MLKSISLVAAIILFSGCMAKPAIKYKEVSIPPLNKQSEALLGEALLQQAKGYHAPSITLSAADGIQSSISAGVYCRKNPYLEDYYSLNPKAIAFKDLTGDVIKYGDHVTYNKEQNEVCPLLLSCFNSEEISIKYNPNGFCSAPNSIQKVIEYNGKSGSVLNFTYKEKTPTGTFRDTVANFTADLSDSDTVGYKGAKLQIVKATNNSIVYKVLKNFN